MSDYSTRRLESCSLTLLFITDLLQQEQTQVQMTDSILRFESELRNKLAFKASSKVALDALLFKTFKFFDLNNTGYVPESEFYRSIAKVGVVFETAETMKQVFDHYDKEKQGRINYRDFITEVLFKDSPVQPPTEPSVLGQQPTPLKAESSQSRLQTKAVASHTHIDVIDYIKERLRREGIDSLLSLAVRLKKFDARKSHKLPMPKVESAFTWLNHEQVVLLFSHFKLQANGHLNYAEFVYSLIDKPSPERVALIGATFAQLADTHNEAAINEILKRYHDNPVLSKQSYSRACSLYCEFQSIEDGVFTYEDFEDFLAFLGFGFISDQRLCSWILRSYGEVEEVRSNKSSCSRREFQQESRSQYGVDRKQQSGQKLADLKVDINIEPAKEVFKKPVAVQRKQHQHRGSHQPSEKSVRSPHESTRSSHFIKEMELILLRIKKRLATKGAGGYLLFEKALRGADIDSDMKVSIHEFKKVIQQQRIDITETEASMVFQVFDQEGTGLLNYPEFVYAIRGEIPEHRQTLINRVWEKVKLPGQNYTTYNHLKNHYKAKDHPDIRSGRRFEQDIVKELNQSLLYIQDLNGIRSEEITQQDFVEYLQNLSAATADDQLFETVLTSFWRLDSVNRIEDQYAGSKKRFDMKTKSYLIDHHRYMINGGTVSQNAPFGTYNEPTNYRQ